MSRIEDIYRRCLETVAPRENARMRQVMGRATPKDKEINFEDQTYEVLKAMGEATLQDLSHKTKLQPKEVHSHLMRLSRRGMVYSDDVGLSHAPRIWCLKKSHGDG